MTVFGQKQPFTVRSRTEGTGCGLTLASSQRQIATAPLQSWASKDSVPVSSRSGWTRGDRGPTYVVRRLPSYLAVRSTVLELKTQLVEARETLDVKLF